MEPGELQTQLTDYGAFVKDSLQPQLQELVDKKQELEREINEYNNLKDLLAFLLIENPSEYTSLVDIGSKCLMRAVVEQPTTVYVNVGAGVHVDLPLEEAVKVADKRIALIRRRWDAVHSRATECAAQLDEVFQIMQQVKLMLR